MEGGGRGELKQKSIIKDSMMKKKDHVAVVDDVDSDDELVNKVSEDDKNKSGGGGGNGKKGSNCSGGGGGGGLMKICQAERCMVDLSDAKQYHRRHKVCEHHAKAQVVVVAGIRQRFCQQCSRFHELSEFDDSKRSCRRRLAGHNERRRKNTAESTGETSTGKATAGGSSQLKEIVCGGQVDDRGRIQIISTGQENGINGGSNYKQHFHIR